MRDVTGYAGAEALCIALQQCGAITLLRTRLEVAILPGGQMRLMSEDASGAPACQLSGSWMRSMDLAGLRHKVYRAVS